MKKTFNIPIVAALLALGLAFTSTTRADEDMAKTEAACKQAVENFKQADPGLTNFFSDSSGYALLPSVGEGGLIIGAERGKGLVFEKDKVTGKVTLTEVSIGAQAGGGSFSEVIFFDTPAVLRNFKKSKYEMSAAVKASVAASGAAEHAKYEQGVAVFTLPKSGAMVAADIGGQKFKFEPVK